MISRRKGPGGPTAPHDHSGAGEGGDTLSPGAVELDEDAPFDFGDIQLAYDPAVGADGALVITDEPNDADRATLGRSTGDLTIEGALTESASL